MNDFFYSLKGFVDKNILSTKDAKSLHFKEVPFSFFAPFPFDDIHQIQSLIKYNQKDIIPIYSGNIFTFSGFLKLGFLVTEEMESVTKLISTREAFTFSFSVNSPISLKPLGAFDINFILIKNEVKGSVTMLFEEENTSNTSIIDEDMSITSIDSLFL